LNKNIAVIGTGYWGRNLVRNFYALNALYAVCGKNPKTLNAFKDKYPDAKHFTEDPSALAAPHFHAVAIATPAATNYYLAKEALQAGKDVFVEKL